MVYADILIVLNLIVNYFLLLAASGLLHRKVRTLRIVLAALAGAVSALYIYLPQVPVFIEFIYKTVICMLMTLIAFGIKSLKLYIKSASVLLSVTCGYAGIMIAIWHILKPDGMIINNSVVYFNISPTVLVISTVAAYLLFSLLIKIFGKEARYAAECEITLTAGEKTANLRAIVDTGNSVSDIFGKSEIIIADKSAVNALFDADDTEKQTRYRAIPFNTVSGYSLLEGYRCDSGTVKNGDKTLILQKPVIAASNTPLSDGFNAIVNPKILE